MLPLPISRYRLRCYSSAAGFQSAHDVINCYVLQYSFNGSINFEQHVSQNGFDIDADRAVATRRSAVERKDAAIFESLVNVEQGGFGRVMRETGATEGTGLRHDQPGFSEFLQNAPDHDRIGVYAFCNLF